MTASSTNSTSSLQLLALQEELTDLRDRNDQLNSRLREKEADFGALRKQLEFVAAEKERLRSKVRDLEANLDLVPASLPIVTSPTRELEGGCGGPRMAERKKMPQVQISVTGVGGTSASPVPTGSGGGNGSGNGSGGSGDMFKIRDILLTDNSVESS